MQNSVNNFAFTDGFELLSNEELQNVIGGRSIIDDIGRGINDFFQGITDGFKHG